MQSLWDAIYLSKIHIWTTWKSTLKRSPASLARSEDNGTNVKTELNILYMKIVVNYFFHFCQISFLLTSTATSSLSSAEDYDCIQVAIWSKNGFDHPNTFCIHFLAKTMTEMNRALSAHFISSQKDVKGTRHAWLPTAYTHQKTTVFLSWLCKLNKHVQTPLFLSCQPFFILRFLVNVRL